MKQRKCTTKKNKKINKSQIIICTTLQVNTYYDWSYMKTNKDRSALTKLTMNSSSKRLYSVHSVNGFTWRIRKLNIDQYINKVYKSVIEYILYTFLAISNVHEHTTSYHTYPYNAEKYAQSTVVILMDYNIVMRKKWKVIYKIFWTEILVRSIFCPRRRTN